MLNYIDYSVLISWVLTYLSLIWISFSATEDNFNGWLTTTNSEYNSVLEKAAFVRTVAVRAQERMATDRAAKFLQSEQKLEPWGTSL